MKRLLGVVALLAGLSVPAPVSAQVPPVLCPGDSVGEGSIRTHIMGVSSPSIYAYNATSDGEYVGVGFFRLWINDVLVVDASAGGYALSGAAAIHPGDYVVGQWLDPFAELGFGTFVCR